MSIVPVFPLSPPPARRNTRRALNVEQVLQRRSIMKKPSFLEIDDEAERAAKVEELRAEYAEEIDVLHLASELVVDAVVQPEDLRGDLIRRFRLYETASRDWPAKHNPVTPV